MNFETIADSDCLRKVWSSLNAMMTLRKVNQSLLCLRCSTACCLRLWRASDNLRCQIRDSIWRCSLHSTQTKARVSFWWCLTQKPFHSLSAADSLRMAWNLKRWHIRYVKRKLEIERKSLTQWHRWQELRVAAVGASIEVSVDLVLLAKWLIDHQRGFRRIFKCRGQRVVELDFELAERGRERGRVSIGYVRVIIHALPRKIGIFYATERAKKMCQQKRIPPLCDYANRMETNFGFVRTACNRTANN